MTKLITTIRKTDNNNNSDNIIDNYALGLRCLGSEALPDKFISSRLKVISQQLTGDTP